VQGLGYCSSVVNEGRGDGILDVFCESPGSIAPLVRVRLEDPASGRVWSQSRKQTTGHRPLRFRIGANLVNQVEKSLAAVEGRQPGSYRVSHVRHTVAQLQLNMRSAVVCN
jgi:hypothetical protein